MMEWGMWIPQVTNICKLMYFSGSQSSLDSKRKQVKQLNVKNSYIKKHFPYWNPVQIASSLCCLLLGFLFSFWLNISISQLLSFLATDQVS